MKFTYLTILTLSTATLLPASALANRPLEAQLEVAAKDSLKALGTDFKARTKIWGDDLRDRFGELRQDPMNALVISTDTFDEQGNYAADLYQLGDTAHGNLASIAQTLLPKRLKRWGRTSPRGGAAPWMRIAMLFTRSCTRHSPRPSSP